VWSGEKAVKNSSIGTRRAYDSLRKGHTMRLRSNGQQADTIQKYSDQATTMVQGLAEQAAAAAPVIAGRAKDVGASLTTAAKERAPNREEISDHVSAVQQKITEDLAPTAREVALQAASLALELWHAGRARASELTDNTQQGVVAQAANVKQSAGRRALDATSAVTGKVSTVTDSAGEAANRARSASKHAADTTVHTTKDTGALIFWLGAAASIIYFALLNERRRHQVLKFTSKSLKQLKKAVDDLTAEPRGYPEAQ
jgi:hypothetical protein